MISVRHHMLYFYGSRATLKLCISMMSCTVCAAGAMSWLPWICSSQLSPPSLHLSLWSVSDTILSSTPTRCFKLWNCSIPSL